MNPRRQLTPRSLENFLERVVYSQHVKKCCYPTLVMHLIEGTSQVKVTPAVEITYTVDYRDYDDVDYRMKYVETFLVDSNGVADLSTALTFPEGIYVEEVEKDS